MKERARRLTPIVTEALSTFRVVVVTGPRQAGKTTLVRQVLAGGGTLQRLDDETTLQAALADPPAFAAYGPAPRAFDEIQRAGDPLVRAIKVRVDDDATPGQYLLDGSADFLTVPTISESLAGRAVFHQLWPFSQGELHGGADGLLARLVTDPEALRDGPDPNVSPPEYLERLCIGGFPEAATLTARDRGRWFDNYVRTVTQRDVTELTGARRANQLPKLLAVVAARTAGELVVSHVHDDAGFGNVGTTEDYLGFLAMTYLTQTLPAWSRNLTSKATRRNKIYISDSALAAHLLAKNPDALARPDDRGRGQLVETFVVNELLKQQAWCDHNVTLHHFRDRAGAEIDVIVETRDSGVIGIEVKAASTVTRDDFRHLAWLRDRLGDQFQHGVVLYSGARPIAFGDGLTALPIAYLWLAEG